VTIVLDIPLVNYNLQLVRWKIRERQLQSPDPIIRSLAHYRGGFAFTTTHEKAKKYIWSLNFIRHSIACVHSSPP
jgi:hypothetical protein